MSDCEEKLVVKDLRKTYSVGEVVTEVLKGVDFEIFEGDFTIVTGPSGSGKTTVLNLVGMLDEATSGRILIDGVDTAKLSGGQKDKFRNRKIGFIFQSYNLINELNAVENVMLPALIARTPSREARRKAVDLLEAVGLGEKVDYPSIRLSGGEMQRVSIARALINEPALVLADEPTGNLDSKRTEDILRLLKEMNTENNQTFMVVTHDPMVVQTASKIIDILDGVVREIIHKSEFHCPYRTLVPHPGDTVAVS
jgi:putative ABC transport system ATP-binding protein